jgi:hypothetical protein
MPPLTYSEKIRPHVLLSEETSFGDKTTKVYQTSYDKNQDGTHVQTNVNNVRKH